MTTESEQEPAPEFVEGYNDGRILDKYKPEIAKHLNASQSEKNEYLNGLKAGVASRKQTKKEAIIQMQKDMVERGKNKRKSK